MYQVTFSVGCGLNRKEEPLDDLAARIQAALNYIADSFGGCTVTSGLGAWKDETGRLITEQCRVFTSDISGLPPGVYLRTMADKTAGALRDIFYQTAVHVTITEVKTWDRYEKETVFVED